MKVKRSFGWFIAWPPSIANIYRKWKHHELLTTKIQEYIHITKQELYTRVKKIYENKILTLENWSQETFVENVTQPIKLARTT